LKRSSICMMTPGSFAVVAAYILFRRRDGERFKFARFGDLYGATKRNRVYLEDV
jgi:hypothetical protein